MTFLAIDVVALLPALLPLGGVIAVLAVDLIAPTLRRAPYAVALLASIGAAGATVPGLRQGAGSVRATFCVAGGWISSGPAPPEVAGQPPNCLWEANALGSTLQLVAALAAAVCIALAWPGRAGSDPSRSSHRHPEQSREPVEAVLLLTALAGTVIVAASRDIATWLIALELATLPIVVLVALSGTRGAVAGAVQLLLTSLVSFSMLVLGVGLWFAATGSPFFSSAAAVLAGEGAVSTPAGAAGVGWSEASPALLSLSVVILLVGLGFKLSLVPFHAWTPTAYVGSTTPIATFLATVSKVGGLAALLVVLQSVAVLGRSALIAIAILSALSMTLGNIMALRQDDVVRLLAWSTVAQAGWVIMPLVSVSPLGIRTAAIYLFTYVAATLVAFAVVVRTVHDSPGSGRMLSGYAGLWQRSPWRAGALVLALTSLAGLPPGIFGLVGKVAAFRPVIAQGWIWLALIAAANAVLGVAVYLRWLRPVITAADAMGPPEAAREPRGPGHRVAIVATVFAVTAALLVLSVQPDLLLGLMGGG